MAETNPNSRLEAFCDGVFAIALTLLIIDVGISSSVEIQSTAEFWRALKNITPSIFAFLLSFAIIFITWFNHYACLRLINDTCSSFIFANGFLLLTVVAMPFSTALLGEYITTEYSSPAVVIYNSIFAVQAIAWILLTAAALQNKLTKDEKSTLAMQKNNRNGYFAFAIYSSLAIAAFWFPQIVAAITTMLWIFWLVHGINILQPNRSH